MGSKGGRWQGLRGGKGWRKGDEGEVWWFWCNLWWRRAVGFDMEDAPGRPLICPIFGLDMRGGGQPGHFEAPVRDGLSRPVSDRGIRLGV